MKESSKNIITIRTIGHGIAEVNEDFILEEKPLSRLVFQAQIHENGIKGKLIRQRRESKDDSWIPDKVVDIRDLKKNEAVNVHMNTEAVKKFYSAIHKLANILNKKGIEYGQNEYAVVDPNSIIITDENKAVYIKKILAEGYSKEIWNNLVELDPSLATKLSYARIQIEKKQIIKELVSRLKIDKFSETSGSNSWQKWIYKNNWLFGANYKTPIEKTRINTNGIMPDFLFPTVDGFVDILEIKLPNDDVIASSNSHPGAWKWTQTSNIAIGQVVNYLSELIGLDLKLSELLKSSMTMTSVY